MTFKIGSIDGKRRNTHIMVRLSEYEKDKLLEVAAAYQMTVSELVRTLIERRERRPWRPQ